MRFKQRQLAATWPEKALHYTCLGLGYLHRGVATALTFTLHHVGRLLGYVPWSARFGLMAAFMTAALLNIAAFGLDAYLAWLEATGEQEDALVREGVASSFHLLQYLLAIIGFFLLLVTFLSFLRHWITYLLQKIAGAAYMVLMVFVLIFLVRIPSMLYQEDHELFDQVARNDCWIAGVWAWLPFGALGALFLICLMLRRAKEFYVRPAGVFQRRGRGAREPEPEPEAADPMWGDELVENLRTGGEDPRFRTSTYWSGFIHFFVLFLYPLLQRGCGMEDPYGIPKGDGVPEQVVKVKVIKKKKKKTFVLNMNSPIIFWIPEDSDMSKILDKETEDQYQATALLGKKGTKGGKGGWPNGMENARVRFIRLEYSGGDWDQDMGQGADYNMLIQFHKLTQFKIADRVESVRINRLRRFPKHRAPPFVYITGMKGLHLSREEIKTLRWYCLEEGGMIFADNGGGSFNRAFRNAMRRVFPDKRWIDVANDDILYRRPFLFPNGAPRFWHHSGDRALGIKHQGRWIVYYHQGDINDAWKTGHSGASPEQAMAAYKLAVNIINYSFNQYMAIHFGN